MFAWMLRNPHRAAILAGILVALLFGWASFPRHKTIEKTLADWAPQNLVPAGPARNELAGALAAVRGGNQAAASVVSPDEFKTLQLPATYVETAPGPGRDDFVITYVGRDASGRTYVADRKVAAAAALDPRRWLYRAAEAEVDQFNNILRLTFERDLSGLVALLVMDLIVGAFYGVVVGLILSVLGLESIDKAYKPKSIPAPTQPSLPLEPRGIFRA
jgi:hypothetical protein